MSTKAGKLIENRLGSIFGPDFTVTYPDGEKFHLGYSRLTKYAECPRAYKYSYVDKLRREAGVPLRRGTAYHNTVELMLKYKVKWGKLMDVARCDKIAVIKAGEENLTESETLKVVEAVRYYHSTMYHHHQPLAVEEEFDIKRGGVRLTGRIDLIETTGRISDHKFSYDTWAESRAKYGVQPIIYQWSGIDIFEPKYKIEFPDLKWRYTGFEYCIIRLFPHPKIQRIEIPLVKQEASDWWEEQIFEWCKSIRRGYFPAYPHEKTCGFCDFKDLCKPTVYKIKMTNYGEDDENE